MHYKTIEFTPERNHMSWQTASPAAG